MNNTLLAISCHLQIVVHFSSIGDYNQNPNQVAQKDCRQSQTSTAIKMCLIVVEGTKKIESDPILSGYVIADESVETPITQQP